MGTLTANVISTTYKNIVFQKADNKIYYTNSSDVDTEITTFASALTLSGLITATAGIKLGNNIIYASDGATAITTTNTTGNVTINGDLTITGGNITNAIQTDALLTAGVGVKLGNNIIYNSEGTAALTLDTDEDLTITGDLKVSGGIIEGTTDADLEIRSDGNVSFYLDDDNDETGQKFYFYNDTTEIATLDESGNLQIDGDLTISGGNITNALTLDSTLAVASNVTITGNLLFSGARDIVWTDSDGLELKDVGGSTYCAFSADAIAISQPTTFDSSAKATFSGGVLIPVKKMSDANVTLTAADSGKCVILEHATTSSRDLILPAVADGLNFKVKISLDLGQVFEIKAAATGNFFEGGVTFIDTNTDAATTTFDTQILAASADEGISLAADTKAGTWVDLICDGTTWFISGTVYADTAPTYVDV